MNVLKFDYNVVSNEPMEYLHSRYEDTFKATIVTGKVKEPTDAEYDNSYYSSGNGYTRSGIYTSPWLIATEDDNETIIAYESVNASYWGKDEFDTEHRVDVKFPDGDQTVYQIGWKTLTYDISKFQGQTFALKLQVWDLTDSIYPTAALYDHVRFAKAEKSSLTLTGTKEIDNHDYSERQYQFNALVKDPFGETITGDITLRPDDKGYRQPVVEQVATFALKGNIPNFSIDAQTGVLTVSEVTTADVVTIVAANDTTSVELVVPIAKLPEHTHMAELAVNGTTLNVTYSESLYTHLQNWEDTELELVTIVKAIPSEDPSITITTEDTSAIITANEDGYGFSASFTQVPLDVQHMTLNFRYGSLSLYRNAYGYWQF